MDFVGNLMDEPWLKAFMFPSSGRMTLTIKALRKQKVAFEEQEPAVHIIMSFEEIKSELTVAKINMVAIIKMFGNDVSRWPGKRITFFATTEIMPHALRKTDPCIRIYGSPDIDKKVSCEWTPPKRKKITYLLRPTGMFKAASEKIDNAEKEDLARIESRVVELRQSNDLNETEASKLLAKIAKLR